MKVRNESEHNYDPGGNLAPHLFYGDCAPGTERQHTDAPLMSLYWDTTNAAIYVKTANNRAAADWTAFVTTGGTQTITGTKTFSALNTMTIAALPVTTVGVGAVVSGKATAVEYGDGVLHQTVLTLTLTGANDLDLAGDADNSKGVKVYDFPVGRIHVLGATINASVTVNNAFNASDNDIFYMAVGSVDGTQAANADLTSTEADLIPKTTLDTESNATLTLDWHAALAAAAQFDGTTTALDVFVNAAVANASTTKAVTVAVTGTLTITWINLGDY